MSSIEKKEHLNIFSQELKKIGFKKKANRWTIKGDIITKLIELQSSFYWNGYYINLGVCFNEIRGEDSKSIASYDCHLVRRVNPMALASTIFLDEEFVTSTIEEINAFFEKAASIEWLRNNFPKEIKIKNIELMNIKVIDFRNYLEKE